MTTRKTERVTKTTEHAFEESLGVPSGTTETEMVKVTSEPCQHESYDEKDSEIEDDFVDIQDKAVELYELLLDELSGAEPGKVARLAEVANSALNTALAASDRRRNMKEHIDKLKQKERMGNKSGGPKTTNNNLIVATHEQVLGLINSGAEREPIEHNSDDSDE